MNLLSNVVNCVLALSLQIRKVRLTGIRSIIIFVMLLSRLSSKKFKEVFQCLDCFAETIYSLSTTIGTLLRSLDTFREPQNIFNREKNKLLKLKKKFNFLQMKI